MKGRRENTQRTAHDNKSKTVQGWDKSLAAAIQMSSDADVPVVRV